MSKIVLISECPFSKVSLFIITVLQVDVLYLDVFLDKNVQHNDKNICQNLPEFSCKKTKKYPFSIQFFHFHIAPGGCHVRGITQMTCSQ